MADEIPNNRYTRKCGYCGHMNLPHRRYCAACAVLLLRTDGEVSEHG